MKIGYDQRHLRWEECLYISNLVEPTKKRYLLKKKKTAIKPYTNSRGFCWRRSI